MNKQLFIFRSVFCILLATFICYFSFLGIKFKQHKVELTKIENKFQKINQIQNEIKSIYKTKILEINYANKIIFENNRIQKLIEQNFFDNQFTEYLKTSSKVDSLLRENDNINIQAAMSGIIWDVRTLAKNITESKNESLQIQSMKLQSEMSVLTPIDLAISPDTAFKHISQMKEASQSIKEIAINSKLLNEDISKITFLSNSLNSTLKKVEKNLSTRIELHSLLKKLGTETNIVSGTLDKMLNAQSIERSKINNELSNLFTLGLYFVPLLIISLLLQFVGDKRIILSKANTKLKRLLSDVAYQDQIPFSKMKDLDVLEEVQYIKDKMSEPNDQLRDKLNHLTIELNEYKNNEDEYSKALELTGAEIRNLENTITLTNNDIKSYINEIESLKSKVNKKEEEVFSLKKEFPNNNETFKTMSSHMTNLKSELLVLLDLIGQINFNEDENTIKNDIKEHLDKVIVPLENLSDSFKNSTNLANNYKKLLEEIQ